MNKKRNSNIEILRFIAILLIIISHYTVHNGVDNYTLAFGFNRVFLETMTLGKIGSILFVLISGYYLINDKNEFKLSRLFKLWLQIFFYSFVIYVLFVVLGYQTFSIKAFIKSILPITFQEYWFATAYFLLYIFHPFINKLIDTLKREEHLFLIILSLFIFSILSLITMQSFYFSELLQFIMFYTIGSYFGKYKKTVFSNQKLNYLILILSSIVLISSVVIIDLLGSRIILLENNPTYLFSRTSIVTILLGISLFNIFINKKEFSSSFINKISSCVFGVYLISDNNYVRKILWINIFKNPAYVNSNFLILHMIISVSIIFITCIIIEYFRKNIIDKIYDKYISKYIDKIQEIFNKSYNKMFVNFVENR